MFTDPLFLMSPPRIKFYSSSSDPLSILAARIASFSNGALKVLSFCTVLRLKYMMRVFFDQMQSHCQTAAQQRYCLATMKFLLRVLPWEHCLRIYDYSPADVKALQNYFRQN